MKNLLKKLDLWIYNHLILVLIANLSLILILVLWRYLIMLNNNLIEFSQVVYQITSFLIIGIAFIAVTKDFLNTLKNQTYNEDGN